MMYGVLLRSSDRDIGWFRDSRAFIDEFDAHEFGHEEVELSKEQYRKCAEAGIDVPFFVDYKVIPL